MRLKMLVAIVGAGTAWLSAQAQDRNDRLVRLLANDRTQAKTVAKIVASGQDKLPLLFSWTKNPPEGLGPIELITFDVGLADIFGHLKSNEAIPFLIKHISMQRSTFLTSPGFGLKADSVILERMPAIAALISIGTPALEPLEHAFYPMAPSDDRIPLLFAISRIVTRMSSQDPEEDHARTFLHSTLGELNVERSYVQDALTALDRVK